MPTVELSAGKEDVTGREDIVCATCAGVLELPGISGVSRALVLAKVRISSGCGSARRDCKNLARSRLYSEPLVSASERSLAIQDL
jgi:hypothetical protein